MRKINEKIDALKKEDMLSNYVEEYILKSKTDLNGGKTNIQNKNISSDILFLAAKQLSLFMTFNSFSKSFYPSISGVVTRMEHLELDTNEGLEYSLNIIGVDKDSIKNAIQYSYFGDWYNKEIYESAVTIPLIDEKTYYIFRKNVLLNKEIKEKINIEEPDNETISAVKEIIDKTILYLDLLCGDLEEINYLYKIKLENRGVIGYIDAISEDNLILITDEKDDEKNIVIAIIKYLSLIENDKSYIKKIKTVNIYNPIEDTEIKIFPELLSRSYIEKIKKEIML